MQKNTIVKISSILQCQKIPKGNTHKTRKQLFPNWKEQKTHHAQPRKHITKQKIEKKIRM